MLTSGFCNFFFLLLFTFVNPLIMKDSLVHRWFIFVPFKMSWFDAQRYCREHHTDLAAFRNVTEIEGLQTPCSGWFQCWIGLHKDNNDVWSWSNGEELRFTHWYAIAEFFNKDAKCASMGEEKWARSPCSGKRRFVCHEDVILMKEKKTWEEALERCRSLDPESSSSGAEPLYTLAHVNISGGNPEASEAALAAETEELWVGLRFLAGRWLWVNGKPVNEELPVCPPPGSYCGVMTTSGDLRPENDCSERRNFLCSRRNYST